MTVSIQGTPTGFGTSALQPPQISLTEMALVRWNSTTAQDSSLDFGRLP